MEFRCLIELLKEKKLIKVNPQMLKHWERALGMLKIETKYKEVADKIEESINPEKTIVHRINDTTINLYKKESILELLDSKTFGKDEVVVEIDCNNLWFDSPIIIWINGLEDYEVVKIKRRSFAEDYLIVKNLTIEYHRKRKQEEEKQEALAFLESLP